MRIQNLLESHNKWCALCEVWMIHWFCREKQGTLSLQCLVGLLLLPHQGDSIYVVTVLTFIQWKYFQIKMSCTSWKQCTVIVSALTVFLTLAIVFGVWLVQRGALGSAESADVAQNASISREPRDLSEKAATTTVLIMTTTTITTTTTTTMTTTTTTPVSPCPMDSASSLLMFPNCLNMEGVTLESLLTGNQSHQIIDLLRKHVKDDKVKLIKGSEQYIPVVADM